MIWAPEHTAGEAQSPLAAHVTARIRAAGGEALRLSPEHVQELARAVECFLQEQCAGEYVDQNCLVALASQVLSALGEGVAARRVYLFGTGLVRPAEWVATGNRSMWILDLKEMTVREDASLEMIFFSGLSAALESIADVWDEASGEGVLGLRHVCSTAGALLGGRNKKAVSALVRETVERSRAKLQQIAADRGWREAPGVLNLDL